MFSLVAFCSTTKFELAINREGPWSNGADKPEELSSECGVSAIGPKQTFSIALHMSTF
jgi:hypothetical protein